MTLAATFASALRHRYLRHGSATGKNIDDDTSVKVIGETLTNALAATTLSESSQQLRTRRWEDCRKHLCTMTLPVTPL